MGHMQGRPHHASASTRAPNETAAASVTAPKKTSKKTLGAKRPHTMRWRRCSDAASMANSTSRPRAATSRFREVKTHPDQRSDASVVVLRTPAALPGANRDERPGAAVAAEFVSAESVCSSSERGAQVSGLVERSATALPTSSCGAATTASSEGRSAAVVAIGKTTGSSRTGQTMEWKVLIDRRAPLVAKWNCEW